MLADTTYTATDPQPRPPAAYTAGTASMQPDPEARHTSGAASESSSGMNIPAPLDRAFPILTARCASHPLDAEWVPDREQAVVPGPMRALCRRCESRPACLLWALTAGEQGYWAGTTTQDRTEMIALGATDIHTADRLQDRARASIPAALHTEGQGSMSWYRTHGCRCQECRTANARYRAQQRARSRSRAAGATRRRQALSASTVRGRPQAVCR